MLIKNSRYINKLIKNNILYVYNCPFYYLIVFNDLILKIKTIL